MPFNPNSAKKTGKKIQKRPYKKRRTFHQRKDGNALWKSTGWSTGKPRQAHQNRTGKTLFNTFQLNLSKNKVCKGSVYDSATERNR